MSEATRLSDANNAVITEFYQAFNRLDAEAMSACYTEDVLFSDPVFGELRGRQDRKSVV